MKFLVSSIPSFILLLFITGCGSEQVSFSKGETRTRINRSIESSDSQAIQPIDISVQNDGTVSLNNRLRPSWDGVGFVGSRQFDIVPVE